MLWPATGTKKTRYRTRLTCAGRSEGVTVWAAACVAARFAFLPRPPADVMPADVMAVPLRSLPNTLEAPHVLPSAVGLVMSDRLSAVSPCPSMLPYQPPAALANVAGQLLLVAAPCNNARSPLSHVSQCCSIMHTACTQASSTLLSLPGKCTRL